MSGRIDPIVSALQTNEAADLQKLRATKLPRAGLYAWWEIDGALTGVPAVAHPSEPELALVYVGIGPASSTSNETLRSRLVGKHLDGNTGSSTLRLTLAANLISTLSLHPRATAKKVLLTPADNEQLSEWMSAHLRVSWTEHPTPWLVEKDVIEALRPPLNIDHNRSHAYCPINRSYRAEFKRRGRAA